MGQSRGTKSRSDVSLIKRRKNIQRHVPSLAFFWCRKQSLLICNYMRSETQEKLKRKQEEFTATEVVELKTDHKFNSRTS